jgi:hypothetical protein
MIDDLFIGVLNMRQADGPNVRKWILLTILFLVIVGIVVTGCGGDPGNQGSQSSAETPPSMICHSRQPLAIYIAVDDTTAYNKQFFTDGLKRFADFLDQLASTPGFSGANIFVGRVHDNSFDTSSVVQSFSIPSVPCPPSLLLTPTPTVDSSDPAGSAQMQSDAGDAIATAVASWNDKNKNIVKDVRVQTDQMRSLLYLSENPDEKDVYGAIHRAAVDLSGYPNAMRWLIFLSDLQDKENFKWSEPGALLGVHALVLFYECNFGTNFKTNDTCNQNFWERYFQSVGIRSQDLHFLTPEQSGTMANPFM